MRKITLLLTVFLAFSFASSAFAVDSIDCWFPPGWKAKGQEAKAITDALSSAGVTVKPRIAKSYPEILGAFSSGQPSLVYVGSFVQAIINARSLGVPLAQKVDGKEYYSGVLIYPEGQDPAAILKNSPGAIAYAVGASSGESSAKAATGGKASIGTPNHGASIGAVKAGKAKAAVVKNWWWEGNKDKYPDMTMYKIPGVSEEKNPDNVLTASNAVPADIRKKLADTAMASSAFGGKMQAFDVGRIGFSVELMKKGNIDPMTYSW